MNVSRLAVLGVALVSAAGAGYVALNLSTPPPAEPVIIAATNEPAVKLVEVLVTIRDVPMGSTVDDALGWQAWPEDALGPSLITKAMKPDAIEAFKGAIARQSFATGEPLRESKLVRSDRGFMSVVLPQGKRAVAVQIAAETAAGGFILPNDHVDVIMTHKLMKDGEPTGEFETETVLANLRVLAIDQTIEEQNGAKVVVGSTATLEVTSEQAEALTAAQQIASKLVLSLRSLEDSVPGGSGYAEFLLAGQPKNGKIRIVRYGRPADVTTRN